MMNNQSLIGIWPMDGDVADASPNALQSVNHGVTFTDDGLMPGKRAAVFDGDARIEVTGACVSCGDFTLSGWIHTDAVLDRPPGDIASQFDPVARRGFNLGLMSYTGAPCNQPNDRNLHFGIDNARIEQDWTDCGRPGNALFVLALCVFDGSLYAGTYESEADETGHVYRWDGGDQWVDCGNPDGSNSVASLAVMNGELYASTACYRAGGSALDDAGNQVPGGGVYRYVEGTHWEPCGRLGDAGEAFSLVVYRGELYVAPMYSTGVFRFDGRDRWEDIGAPGGRRIFPLGVHGGYLYSGGNEWAGVWRFDGETWEDCGRQTGEDSGEEGVESQVYSFATYRNQLHAGTWPSGSVFRHDDRKEWAFTGRLGREREVMGMAVYNGCLYGGTLPLAQVYRYDADVWTLTGRLDFTPDVTYRRAWSMAVYDGRLFCGTLPSGHVYAMEAGANVTHDTALEPGWRHVMAVRDGGRLRLFVDGTQVSESRGFDSACYDLSGNLPLAIGMGQHAGFRGRMADVRIYGCALNASDVKALMG
jgi:hypothetical protein